MLRRVFIAIIVGFIVLLVGIRLIIQQQILQALSELNINYTGVSSKLGEIHFTNLQKGHHTIESLSIYIFPMEVIVQSADIHLERNETSHFQDGMNKSSERSFDLPGWLSVKARDIVVHTPFTEPVTVSGDLHPELNLVGPELTILKEDETFLFNHQTSLKHLHMNGSLSIEGKYTPKNNVIQINGRLSKFELTHALVSSKPIRITSADVNATLHDRKIDATVTSGQSQMTLEADLSGSSPVQFSVTNLQLSLQDLAEWWNIPEQDKCTLDGHVTSTAKVIWPTEEWELRLDAANIETNCSIFDVNALRQGAFSYIPINQTQLRNTGPLTNNWTANVGWLGPAALAAEDSQFYSHEGFQLDSIQTALDEWDKNQDYPRGGSTITQQLAKNLFTGSEKTLYRKLRELIFTLELERLLGKDEILLIYLNIVEFGPNIYGIKEASEKYFVKAPKHLLPEEAAYLAALLPSPTSGYKEAQAGRFRNFDRKRILQNMNDMESLTNNDYAAALNRTLMVIPPSGEQHQNPD
jgi:uncharacterized membrane protein